MNTSESTIQIKQTQELWEATHSGPHTWEIIHLFGSNILPTAFESSIPREKVIEALRMRNPGFRVF